MVTFSDRLKELRLQNSFTQNQIAILLDSKTRVIIYYEKGERVPPLEKLIILADHFNVSLDYLTGRTDNPEVNK